MKSKWNLLYATVTTALLLSACGTTDSQENLGEKTAGATPPIEKTEGEKDKPADVIPTIAELKDAKLTNSDEQDYALSVLPAYTLTSEEPGRDSLLSNENEYVFMRIETMPNEVSQYDNLTTNTIEVLNAAGAISTPVDVSESITLPTGNGIKRAIAFSADTDSGKVTGIIFEKEDLLVRLTIFDSPANEHLEEFVRMGETIEPK